ncbi:hypothetical protein GC209_14390 [bacterium]|nr:hypothetical protein [bacterium]
MHFDPRFQTIRDAALEYAERGWHVFPVPPGAKKSHKSAEHSDGRKWGATIDPAEIKNDWQTWPGANVGIVTGPKSGFFVIEADTLQGHDVDGIANLDALIEKNGPLPATIEALSPSGSWHIYFAWPEGVNVRNTQGEIAPGIDVRGDGGMVVAAPSVKPGAEKPYMWKNPPGLFDLAPCPDWLLKLAVKPKTSQESSGRSKYDVGSAWAQKAFAEELASILAAPQGRRNEMLNTVAFNLGQIVGAGLLDLDHVRARLIGAALSIGLGQDEAEATVASGLDAGMKNPRGPKNETKSRDRASRGERSNAPQIDSMVEDARGRVVWCAENAGQILEVDPAWAGVLAYDDFSGLTVLRKPIPGSKAPKATFRARPITDADLTAALRWFNSHGFPDATRTTLGDAVDAAARAEAFNPVADYLTTLRWDGRPRVGHWLSLYCGAAESPLIGRQGQAWLVSAVARALEPGCKADHALVLEGGQGVGKSSALAALAGPDWFYDGLHDLHSKDASAGLRGKWIIELPELSAMRRTDVEGVKSFLTRTVERFRPAYGRCEVIEQRRCVFAGTTNRTDWLADDTGGRRFWPVAVGRIDLAALTRDRDQLWAEATRLYLKGAAWWLDRMDEAEAATVVATRSADDPWTADVLKAVELMDEASTRDVFERMDIEIDRRTKADAMRISGILTRAGWTASGKFWSGPNRGSARFVPPATRERK